MEAFSGTQADHEGAAENLFSSPLHPQPWRFESLSLKTPHTVPPTPGTALQNKTESRLEKSLGSTFNIQLKQEMGVFQASMLEAMKSLRDKMLSFKKASESDVVQTSDSAKIGPKPGPNNQPALFRLGLLFPGHPTTRMFNLWTLIFMDFHFLPSLKMSSPSRLPSNRMLNPTTRNIIPSRNTQKRCVLKQKSILDKRKHKVRAKYYSQSSSSEEDESSAPIKKPTKPQHKAPQEPELQDSIPPFSIF